MGAATPAGHSRLHSATMNLVGGPQRFSQFHRDCNASKGILSLGAARVTRRCVLRSLRHARYGRRGRAFEYGHLRIGRRPRRILSDELARGFFLSSQLRTSCMPQRPDWGYHERGIWASDDCRVLEPEGRATRPLARLGLHRESTRDRRRSRVPGLRSRERAGADIPARRTWWPVALAARQLVAGRRLNRLAALACTPMQRPTGRHASAGCHDGALVELPTSSNRSYSLIARRWPVLGAAPASSKAGQVGTRRWPFNRFDTELMSAEDHR